jgi:hypothetical protein
VLEYREIRGRTSHILIGPVPEIEGFQDVPIALFPTMLPRERGVFEDSLIPFFPGFPQDKAR